jgi:cysteine desulfurase
VAHALRPDTLLVSVAAANGEIGTVQAIREIGRLTRRHGAWLHVDGVGAVGRIPLLVDECGIDLLSLSANDMYGPPGAGALWVRAGVRIGAQLLGGSQEGGIRAGTENLPAIAGMGVAADLMRAEGPAEVARLSALRDRLLRGILDRVGDTRITGPRPGHRLPHHASLIVSGVSADRLLRELDAQGVAAATGSSCASATGEPSAVLLAIGCDRRAAAGAICFSLGRWTTSDEIDYVVDIVPGAVERIRRLGLA